MAGDFDSYGNPIKVQQSPASRKFEEPTPVVKAEALRDELEKFAVWLDVDDGTEEAIVSEYLQDVRNGWKPDA